MNRFRNTVLLLIVALLFLSINLPVLAQSSPPSHRPPAPPRISSNLASRQSKMFHKAGKRAKKPTTTQTFAQIGALAVAGTEKVGYEGRNIQIVHSKSASKIVAEKLLEHEIAASVICRLHGAGERVHIPVGPRSSIQPKRK